MKIIAILSTMMFSLSAFADLKILAEVNFDNINVQVWGATGPSGHYGIIHDTISLKLSEGQNIYRAHPGMLVRNETINFDLEKKQIRIKGYYESAVYESDPVVFCQDVQEVVYGISYNPFGEAVLSIIGDVTHTNLCE